MKNSENSTQMQFQIEDRGSYKHVKVQEGRLDILSASKLKVELFFLVQNHWNKNIVLDISSCSYCDASGLSAINAGHRICDNAGGMLIVTGIQANIEKLIKICKLDSVWTIAKDSHEVETLLKRKDSSGVANLCA